MGVVADRAQDLVWIRLCLFGSESNPGVAGCRLYEDRPKQCRTWPFWPENLESPRHGKKPANYALPGMGRGTWCPLNPFVFVPQRPRVSEAQGIGWSGLFGGGWSLTQRNPKWFVEESGVADMRPRAGSSSSTKGGKRSHRVGCGCRLPWASEDSLGVPVGRVRGRRIDRIGRAPLPDIPGHVKESVAVGGNCPTELPRNTRRLWC